MSQSPKYGRSGDGRQIFDRICSVVDNTRDTIVIKTEDEFKDKQSKAQDFAANCLDEINTMFHSMGLQ